MVQAKSKHFENVLMNSKPKSTWKQLNAVLGRGCRREWKEANVSAVPKSGDSNDVKNYRLISVIPVVDKVFESLVHQQLYSYLDENHLLKENQSGYRPNRSTLASFLGPAQLFITN